MTDSGCEAKRGRLVPIAMAAFGLVLMGVSAGWATDQKEPEITVTKLTDTLYQLSTDQGSYTTNSLASVGPDGVLLVDTQSEEYAPELKAVVDGFGKGAPKFIINTHRHVEHVGGNTVFGDEPIIVAHDLVRSKLRSGSYLFNEFPDATLPDVTLSETLTIHFNGEAIELTALAGSHDDNEIIVHFTGSKVVHLSSLVNGFNFPSVDSDGDVFMFSELVSRAIEILPEDVVIVSGHNQNGSWEQLQAYVDMLDETGRIVREGLAAGRDVEQLQQDNVLEPWASYAGSYVSLDRWIATLADGLQAETTKKTVFEFMYFALQDQGVAAAVALYRDLKSDPSGDFEFGEYDLLIMGDKLLEKGRLEPAIALLELSLEEYPDSSAGYYTNFDLAKAHERSGHHETALRYCEKALELSPDNENIAAYLEELKGGA